MLISHQFSDLALHVLVSSLGSGLKAAESLANVNLQKFLARDIRVWEHAVKGGEMSFHALTGRWAIQRTKTRKPALKTNLARKTKAKLEKEKTTLKKGGGMPATVTVGGAGDDLDDEEVEEDEDEDAEGEEGPGDTTPSVGKTTPVVPDKESPVLMGYFGMAMCLGRSFQSAICQSSPTSSSVTCVHSCSV